MPKILDENSLRAVKTYVDNLYNSLPDPMIFKGSVGTGGTKTWSTYATGAKTGWTYKVITNHNTDPICKVGDTIIYNGTTWVVIPSGDEPSGTVTSVGLSLPSGEFSITGSPVTESGTLTGSWKTQTANKIFAGPSSGNAASPSFRSLVAADIPALNYLPTNTTYVETINGASGAVSLGDITGLKYLTTAPQADNTDGTLKLVVLSSEPAAADRKTGYIYIITE